MTALLFDFGMSNEDIPLDNTFAQEKDFKRIILQPNEEFKLNLNEYFRGQFLKYELIADTDLERELIDTQKVIIEDPVNIKIDVNITDSPDPETSYYTSTTFKDDLDQTFFVFLDSSMYLKFYDISAYLEGDQSKIILLSDININDSKYISSSAHCSHLTAIKEGSLYFIFCQAANNISSTFVIINITSIRGDISVKYVSSNISYSEYNYGRFKTFTELPNSYGIIALRNMTSSFFELLNIQKSDFSVRVKDTISYLEYPSYSNDTSFLNYTSLSISDIMPLQNVPEMILISDYSVGLFVMRIMCTDDNCTYQTFARVSFKYAGKLQLLTQQTDQKIPNVLMAVVQPPIATEINIQDLYNPFIGKQYFIETDRGYYIGLNCIDSDERFIAFQILKLDDFKPYIRIFDRLETLNSFALSQFEYAPLYVYGHYLKFLQYNHLILKTSESFKIIKISPFQLVANTYNITKSAESIFETADFDLLVSNSEDKMNIPLELILVDSTFGQTLSTVPALQYNPNQTYKSSLPRIYYNCGQYKNVSNNISESNFTLTYIDELFSGPINDIVVESTNSQYPDAFIHTGIPSLIDQYINDIDFTNCRQNHLMYFIEDELNDYQLLCIAEDGFLIDFIDILQERNETDNDTQNKFAIGEIDIAGYLVDNDNQFIYIFTNMNKKGEKNITCHIYHLFNILSWMKVDKLGETYQNVLTGFVFDDNKPLSFNSNSSTGIIKSAKQNELVTIVAFIINDLVNFDLLAQATLRLTGNTTIINIKVTTTQGIWILLSNNTLHCFKLVKKSISDETKLSYRLKKVANLAISSTTNIDDKNVVWDLDFIFSKIIFFVGDNSIRTIAVEDDALELSSNTTIGLSYTNLAAKIKNFRFVLNSKGYPVYQKYGKYLFILFNDTALEDTIYLNVYDISTWRHNNLMAEIPLPIEFAIDLTYLNIHTISNDDYSILLILQSKYQALYFQLSLHYTLQINGKKVVELDNICKYNDMIIDYKLYPTGNDEQKAYVRLLAHNNGLLVKNNDQQKNATVAKLDNYNTIDNLAVDAQFNMNNWFSGYNVYIDYEVLKTDLNPSGKSNNIQAQQIPDTINSAPIEFLTNSNRMVNFFTLNDTMVIFDTSNYIDVVYSIKQSQYDRKNVSEILGCENIIYAEFFRPYFIYECNHTIKDPSGFYDHNYLRLGITKIFSSAAKPDTDTLDEYKSFRDQLFIKITQPQMQLTKRIRDSSVFVKKPEDIIAILAFDIPGELYLSSVQFYNVTFDQSKYTKTTYMSTKTLNQVTGNFDTFRVSAVQVVPESDTLIIAVENYGLVLYCLTQFKVRRTVSLITEVRYDTFVIQGIIAQDKTNFHLILNKYGIISLMLQYNETDKNQETSEIKVDPSDFQLFVTKYFNFLEKETCSNQYYAVESQGFAFFTSQPLVKYGVSSRTNLFTVRYFGYYYQNNTKLLASRYVDKGLECSLLRPYPIQLALENETSSAEYAYYVMIALQCGPDLYFQTFSRVYELYMLHEDNIQSNLVQTIEITAFNEFDRTKMIFEVQTLEDYMSSLPIYYYLFIILIALVLASFQVVFRSKAKEKKKKHKSIKTQESTTSQTSEKTDSERDGTQSSRGFFQTFFSFNRDKGSSNGSSSFTAFQFKSQQLQNDSK